TKRAAFALAYVTRSGQERKATSRPERAPCAGAAAANTATAAAKATRRPSFITRVIRLRGTHLSRRRKVFTTAPVTPAIEVLRTAAVEYRLHEYEGVEVGEGDYAVAVAAAVGVEPERLFKTLLASVDGRLEVFVIPADRQLDLRAVGKRAVMAERAAAERATGYVAGGISPLGQRRPLPTTVDESALELETVLVSAGRRGLQVELDPRELVRLTGAEVRAVAKR